MSRSRSNRAIELVDAALVPVVGGVPAHDDGGDIPIRSGSAIAFVRVAVDGPLIELFSPVLVEVEGSPLALERISQLNRWVRFVSFGWDSGTVYASMHLYCHPFVPEHLRHAVGVLTSVADRLDDELRLGLGGRRFFGDEDGDGTGGAPAADSSGDDTEVDNGELPEALLAILSSTLTVKVSARSQRKSPTSAAATAETSCATSGSPNCR